MKLHEFIPQMIGEHGGRAVVTVAVAVPLCAVCTLPMVDRETFSDQARRAGWPTSSKNATNVEGRHICDECAEKGHARFRCALCKEERPFADVYEGFGVGTVHVEYLCAPCYESVPAKAWDSKRRELEDEHRHDYC